MQIQGVEIKKNKIFVILIIIYSLFLAYLDSVSPQRSIDAALVYAGEVQYGVNDLTYWMYSDLFSSINVVTFLTYKLLNSIFFTSFVIQFFQLVILTLSIYFLMKYFLINNFLNLTCIFLITTTIPSFVKNLTSVYGLILRTEHTFGQMGLTLSLAILTMLTYKKYGWALFLLGIQYGIHPAWALWSTLLLISAMYFQRRSLQSNFIKFILSLFSGSLITLTLFLYHKFLLPNSSYEMQSDPKNLIQVYLKFWDYHRNRPFDLSSILYSLTLVILLFSLSKLIKKSYFELANLNIIVAISSLVSTLLYLLNDGLLQNNFVPLSLLMPGRYMNFHALLILPIIMININYLILKVKSKFTLIDNYLFKIIVILLLPFFLLYAYFFTSYMSRIPFNLENSAGNIYNSKAVYCKYLNRDDKQVLTAGISGRLIPINCKRSIILDSHTTDFIPYLPKGVNQIKNLTEQLYGISFNDPRINFRIAGKEFYRSGAIPPEIIKPIWEMRTLSDWNLLACKFNFSNIVTPTNFKINLPIVFSDNNVSIFRTDQNCNNFVVPAISASGEVEISNNGQRFIWVQGDEAYLNIFNNTQSNFSKNFSLDFVPNICNNPIKLILKIGNLSTTNLTITDKKVKFNKRIDLNQDKSVLLTISAEPINSPCLVSGDDREFTVGLLDPSFSS